MWAPGCLCEYDISAESRLPDVFGIGIGGEGPFSWGENSVWYSQLFDRSIHAQWLERGSRRFEERLRVLTDEVMKHKAMFDGAFDTGQNLNKHVWSHGFCGGKMLMPLLNHHGMSNNAIRSSVFETLREAVGRAAGAMRMQEMRYESGS